MLCLAFTEIFFFVNIRSFRMFLKYQIRSCTTAYFAEAPRVICDMVAQYWDIVILNEHFILVFLKLIVRLFRFYRILLHPPRHRWVWYWKWYHCWHSIYVMEPTLQLRRWHCSLTLRCCLEGGNTTLNFIPFLAFLW